MIRMCGAFVSQIHSDHAEYVFVWPWWLEIFLTFVRLILQLMPSICLLSHYTQYDKWSWFILHIVSKNCPQQCLSDCHYFCNTGNTEVNSFTAVISLVILIVNLIGFADFYRPCSHFYKKNFSTKTSLECVLRELRVWNSDQQLYNCLET